MKSSEISTPEKAWQCALRLLAGRDYTVSRLRDKLCQREFSREDAEAAVTRLVNGGLLDDRRFAERFAESALSVKCFYGPRLRYEMSRRGFSADVIEDVIGGMKVDHQESDGIRTLLERRFPGFCYASADEREKRRVIGFLQRRGFSIGSIQNVIRQ